MKLEFLKLTVDHLDKVREMRNLPNVRKNMYNDHIIEKDEHYNWFNKNQNNPSIKQWVIKVDDEIVGFVSLDDIDYRNKRCSWAYYSISKQILFHHIELNVLNYVFEKLKFNKLCSEVLSFNKMIIRIHKRFGSVIEGTRRQHILRSNEYLDVVVMGIIKEEWPPIKEKYKNKYIAVDFEE